MLPILVGVDIVQAVTGEPAARAVGVWLAVFGGTTVLLTTLPEVMGGGAKLGSFFLILVVLVAFAGSTWIRAGGGLTLATATIDASGTVLVAFLGSRLATHRQDGPQPIFPRRRGSST